MSNVSEWETNANDNDAAPPDGAPEGMSRAAVNDVMREMMAAAARWYGDTSGRLVSTGSAGAYVLTSNSDHAALADQSLLVFVANHSCPGTSTLHVDGLGAEPLRSRLGEELVANAFLAGDTVVAAWNAEEEFYAVIAPAPRFALTELATAAAFVQPGGRLSLSTGVAVHTTDQTAKTTVFRVPYNGSLIPLWDGTFWRVKEFSETSQALSDTTKSPAAAVLNSVYDLFDWDDGGTIRCTRGPAWDDFDDRGTGSGSTELELFGGVLVNKHDITNGPLARRGFYRGTIATDANVQLNMMFRPSAAAGGSNNRIDVWNAYNRVNQFSVCRDSTNDWVYSSNVWRPYNGGSGNTKNRITFVRGLATDAISALFSGFGVYSSAAIRSMATGIALDATDALADGCLPGIFGHASGNTTGQMIATYEANVAIGRHFVQALENHLINTATGTWLGDPDGLNTGLVLKFAA